MDKQQKRTLLVLLLISLVYFLIFALPNRTGAADRNMLSVFEPDEYAQYPVVIRMLTPGKTLAETAFNFIVYRHFYYGYPFYLLSTLAALPVRLLFGLSAAPQIMLVLRQVISVLPMLLALLLLVYLQTAFRSLWKALILFCLLLSVPAVVRNNLWWHPDSLTVLFVVLTFFFLDRDKLSFKTNFLLAAIACGLAVGTKLIGLFFFLAIPIYIIWGLFTRRIKLRQAAGKATLFVLIMIVTVVLTNPLLLIPEGRARIIATQQKQAAAMSFGWFVAYGKGPASWADILSAYYGQWYFQVFALVVAVLAALKSSRRVLNTLILAWAIPFAAYILFFIAIKPKHFFLPTHLPLYSSLAFALPFDGATLSKNVVARLLKWGSLALVVVQILIFLPLDISQYNEALYREQSSEALQFYNKLELAYLACLPPDEHLLIFRDVRAYVPVSDRWDVELNWELVDYPYIRTLNPDLIVLQQQKIKDYTLPGVVENAADPVQMQRTYQFYLDASRGNLQGYHLLMQDAFGMAFARQDRLELFQCNP